MKKERTNPPLMDIQSFWLCFVFYLQKLHVSIIIEHENKNIDTFVHRIVHHIIRDIFILMTITATHKYLLNKTKQRKSFKTKKEKRKNQYKQL